jgi:hypothetical protein
MIILRLVLLVFTAIMTVVTLVIGVSVMLGMGWLAVAVPVLVILGLIAAGRALWRRYRRPGRADGESPSA